MPIYVEKEGSQYPTSISYPIFLNLVNVEVGNVEMSVSDRAQKCLVAADPAYRCFTFLSRWSAYR